MNTEEKLSHFRDICAADTRGRAEKMLAEQQAALDARSAAHKAEALHRQSMQLQVEAVRIANEQNKEYSLRRTEIRKKINAVHEDLKDCLFVELRDRLANFMETPDYLTLLKEQIRAAKAFAGDDAVRIYLDPTDEALLPRLNLELHTDLLISRYSFLGGTRAVIPSKNILIDNSFATKLDDARAAFRFTLEDKNGGTACHE